MRFNAKFRARRHTSLMQRHVKGVFLIEALVAVAVLSIGIMGMAALQLRAVQTADASFQRTIANIQAQDLVERYWAGVCFMPNAAPSIEDSWRTVQEDHPMLPQWAATVEVDGSNTRSIQISWADRDAGAMVGTNNPNISTFDYWLLPLPACRP